MFAAEMSHFAVGAQKWIVKGPAGCSSTLRTVALLLMPGRPQIVACKRGTRPKTMLASAARRRGASCGAANLTILRRSSPAAAPAVLHHRRSYRAVQVVKNTYFSGITPQQQTHDGKSNSHRRRHVVTTLYWREALVRGASWKTPMTPVPRG